MNETWAEMDHDERLAAVREALDNSQSCTTLGQRLGVDPSYISMFAHRQGLRFPYRESSVAKFSVASPEELGRSTEGCAWPVREPVGADLGFCGAKTLPRKSYCQTHANDSRYKNKNAQASTPT